MLDETSPTSLNSMLREKLRNLVSEGATQDDGVEPKTPAVWRNAEEMFASEFA